MNHSWGRHRFPRPGNAGTDQANDKWSNCQQYPKHPGPAPNNNHIHNNYHQQQHGSSFQSTAEWDRPGSSSQQWHSSEPEAEEDFNGQLYERDKEDPELTRKRKELQVIEEQIIMKKASIALKTVNVKPPKRRRFTEDPPTPESNKTLRERVNDILLQQNREFPTYGSVANSRRPSLNVQNSHPLKQRVEAAMCQRFTAPPVQPQNNKPVPPPSIPAPHQKELSAEKEEVQKSDQGFMRFLNILNKGVDINKLTEMAKDDTGGLPHSSQTAVQTHSAPCAFESPSVEKKKLEAKEQPPKTEEQQKHLQNILDSLGLSLGTDEISRLGDRTQERLYGKKQSTGEEKTQQQRERGKYSPGRRTRSSSDSSSSSSSSSRSSSRTPSPVRKRRRPSPAYRKRRSSRSPRRNERSHSPYRKKDSHSPRRSKSKNSCPEVRPDSHPQYPPPMPPYPYPPPPYFNPHFPPPMYPHGYSYSQHITYYNHWAYNQPPPPFNPYYPPSLPPGPPPNVPLIPPQQQIDPLQAGSVNLPPSEPEPDSNEFFPPELRHLLKNNSSRCLVPVASMSETVAAKPRNLMSREEKNLMNRANKSQRRQLKKYVNIQKKEKDETKKQHWQEKISFVLAAIKLGMAGISATPGSFPQPRPTGPPKPKLSRRQKKKRKEQREKEEMEKLLRDKAGPGSPQGVPVKESSDEEESEPEPSPAPTEEEVKANLKKKLEAFNNRMKKNVAQPSQTLASQNIKVEGGS